MSNAGAPTDPENHTAIMESPQERAQRETNAFQMNRENLLKLYDRFTRLIERLPGGLQKPILRELIPIRELFLEQRPARLMLIGCAGKSVPELFHAMAGITVQTMESDHGWRLYRVAGRGEILVLDARADTPQAIVDQGLTRHPPDTVIFVSEDKLSEDALAAACLRTASCGPTTPLVGIAFADSSRARLAAVLQAHREFSIRRHILCAPESAPEAICSVLPNPARLEFARLSGAREAQAQIAGALLKSFTAVCGVIGLQPIPLADMPILTSLQTLMVGLIIYTTGKPVRPRIFAEFLGALGLNIGAGILFREGARALIKVVPGWGHAVSGMVAGAGTYAVGRAAIAYFIEETPISETKKLFNNLLPGWRTFARPKLPEGKTPSPKN